jgi:hypothetical protein
MIQGEARFTRIFLKLNRHFHDPHQIYQERMESTSAAKSNSCKIN